MRKLLILFLLMYLMSMGCARLGKGTRGIGSLVGADPQGKAEDLHKQAICDLKEGNICLAEQTLRDALICDPQHAGIHNTLGKVYFQQRRFYEAAWEFEHTLKAMPERAEPLNNLGLVYEAVDDWQQATHYYEMAVAKDDDNPEYIGNLVRCRIRSGDYSSEVYEWLRMLIKVDHRTEWVDWARGQLVFWDQGNREVPADHVPIGDSLMLDGIEYRPPTEAPIQPSNSLQPGHNMLEPLPTPPNDSGKNR